MTLGMSPRPKQLARLGLFYLYEAILDVLLQAYPEYIGPADISRKAGIDRGQGISDLPHDFITMGCLVVLLEMHKVERGKQSDGRGGWRLTEQEYERRRDDI